MSVELIEYCGSDKSIVNTARISTGKNTSGEVLTEKDINLINLLATKGHWTPFASTFIKLKIEAPIFVARQLYKHEVGFVAVELSRRHNNQDFSFYYPSWRTKDNKKFCGHLYPERFGSYDKTVDDWVDSLYNHSLSLYDEMIYAGIAPEQARMVLPQAMMTKWFWSGSLQGYARVCKLRLASDAQQETREIAKEISNIMEKLFPISWKALMSAK